MIMYNCILITLYMYIYAIQVPDGKRPDTLGYYIWK